MKKAIQAVMCVLVMSSLVGCASIDPAKERKDGNVVQVHAIKHIKTGRAINNTNAVVGSNVASTAGMLGAAPGKSLALGAGAIAIDAIIDANAADDEYYVAVTRPDDTIPDLLGGPRKQRVNQLGKIKMTSSMEGVKVGDWVKVKKEGNYFTLVRCELPESGCSFVTDKTANDLSTAKPLNQVRIDSPSDRS